MQHCDITSNHNYLIYIVTKYHKKIANVVQVTYSFIFFLSFVEFVVEWVCWLVKVKVSHTEENYFALFCSPDIE